jgi:hypothetical protein
MTAYAELLDLARQQVKAAQKGDVDAAVSLLDARAQLIASAPPATVAEKPIIEEVLTLDRELAGFIRLRMLEIREQVLATGRGQTALRGYAAVPARYAAGVRINSAQ